MTQPWIANWVCFQDIGQIGTRIVVLVFTPTADGFRVVSFRPHRRERMLKATSNLQQAHRKAALRHLVKQSRKPVMSEFATICFGK